MSTIQTLREMNDRLATDGAPAWAELLGVLLILGFYCRDLAHIVVALTTDHYPGLRGNDVTVESPVEAFESDRAADIAGRLLAVCFGLGLVWISAQASGGLVRTYILVNAVVPLADPLLLLVSIHKR